MEDSGLVLPALLIEERLRPFLSLGLRYVYTETDHGFIRLSPYAETKNSGHDGILPKNGRERNGFPVNPEQKAASVPDATADSFRVAPDFKPVQETRGQNPSESAHSRSMRPAAHAAPRPENKNASLQADNENSRQSRPDAERIPENWPEPWKSHWKRIGRCRPVVWTYWELGLDVSGRADARRGTLLRKFNAELGLPPGTNAYWPVAAPNADNTLLPNKGVFLAGLERIAPRFTVVCGKRTLEELNPGGATPFFSTQFFHNCLVLALPEVMELLENVELQKKAIAFLRPYLSTIKA